MNKLFNGAPFPEHSAGLVFSGGALERASEKRDDNCLEEAFANPDTKAILFAKGRVFISFVHGDADPLFAIDEIGAFNPYTERTVLLGYEDGRPVLAVPVKFDPETDSKNLPDKVKAIDYRSLAIQGILPQSRMGEVAQGASLLAWHSSHRFCSRCGHESKPCDGGYKRRCPNCNTEHFPRTDPVVIMLAIDGERCLMGRSHHWNEGMYSALAGFVEPGETFEAAVRREIGEEAGISVGRVQYQANQPWPFPHTLMIGCFAQATSTEINMDAEELDDCRWFERREILAALDDAQDAGFFVPPKMAIAHHLIAHWARFNG